MPKGLEEKDFTNPKVWDLVSRGKYDLALLNSQNNDLKSIITNWLNKYSSVNINDDQSVDLVVNWYLFFKSVSNKSNPLFAYLKFLKSMGIKPTFNDLATINNKYQERVLNDNDLVPNNSGDIENAVLSNIDFYKKPLDYQNYWLDIYMYLSDKDKVSDILDNLPDNYVLEINKDKFDKYELEQTNMLRDSILFNGGNNKDKLRDPRAIENALGDLAKYVPDKETTRKNNGTKRRNNEFKNQYKLKDFVDRNRDYFKDNELVHDLRIFLEED